MNYLIGTIKSIVFHSEDNSFNILKVKVEETDLQKSLFFLDDYMTVTGYFPLPMRGESYKFYGETKEHPKYGLQFIVKSYEKQSETSIAGLIEYLSSDLFKGVGIKTATHIVETLGKDAIDQIVDDPKVLDTVPKLSEKVKESIAESIVDNKASESTLIKLYSYGIGPKTAMKIYKYYQTDTISIIEENPYQLMYDIEGIGFERADIIARELGFLEADPRRIKAMSIYLYQYMGSNAGHTYLTVDQMREYLTKHINRKEHIVDEDTLMDLLNELIEEDFFVQEDDLIKLKSVYYAEKNIALKVKELTSITTEINNKKVDDLINLFEEISEIQYTSKQRKAIHQAMEQNLFILTGGPGTGKTTVINGLVFVYAKYHQIPITYNNPLFEVKLIAPTGRAAKRMNETTKLHAETIHRFLGYSFDGSFIHDKNNLVSAKVIIIDEASMLDIFLTSQLFQSIPKESKVIVVGDEDQLPSVQPGQVLKDLIESDLINVVKLSQIHRQAKDSHIISLAHDINHGLVPSDLMKVYQDRYFVKESTEQFQSRLTTIISYLIEQGYDLLDDIQVLIPMYRGITGIDAVNTLLQKTFNKNNSKEIEHNNRTFKVGDKVIQLVNQIDDGIMNGDQGVVIGVTESDTVIVDFDHKEVQYKKGDLINLKHAYAMSIHKSQGSEYKVVIMPIFRSYSIMLKRKLLYTGITRAKEILILVGDKDAFAYGVEHLESGRQSSLIERMQEIVYAKDDQEEKIHTKMKSKSSTKMIKDASIPFDTLGEDFSYDEINPYMFMNEKK
jgi:exodeoxyribonuclease V alpha subunit